MGGTSGMDGSAGTGGMSGAGGTSGAGGNDGGAGSDSGGGSTDAGSGKPCGGIAGRQCPAGEWCDYPGDSCGMGDQQGVCRAQDGNPLACATDFVCGCDGKAYPNPCAAHFFNTDTISTKSCIKGNGPQGAACEKDLDCQTGLKCCGGALPGGPHACTKAAANGGCPLVP
jgi:hypothetical protein